MDETETSTSETNHVGERPSKMGSTCDSLMRRASPSIAGDVLAGAEAIAEFLFGDRRLRRKVYNLVEAGRLPVFRLGINICARKSVLLEWIARQECERAPSMPPEPGPDAPAR